MTSGEIMIESSFSFIPGGDPRRSFDYVYLHYDLLILNMRLLLEMAVSGSDWNADGRRWVLVFPGSSPQDLFGRFDRDGANGGVCPITRPTVLSG